MLKVTKVWIDYQENPLGIAEMPQFGWKLESDRRAVFQTGYRLQLAADAAFDGILYDSGAVGSGESAHITAAGYELSSACRYFVRVKVSAADDESLWSEPASFVTALLTADEWQAPFVSAEIDEADRNVSKGTYVRGAVTVKKPLASAFAFTTALGVYNFWLNGAKVGSDELTPGWTSYRRNLLYQTYDVTDLLREGENMAGAMLGAGWYKGEMGLTRTRGSYGPRTAFAMQLVLHYQDGTAETICTDDSWQGCDSPVVFAEIYDGETYDARLEQPDWCTAGKASGAADQAAAVPAESGSVSAAAWHPVVIEPFDRQVLYPQSGARVREIEAVPARRIFTTPKGEQVIDFGQNMTGRIHVTASGRAGDVIELRCFEVLDHDGNAYFDNLRTAKETMKYIFAADKTVTWYPRFTYMGFQYAQIVSYPGTAKPRNFTAYAMHSQMTRTGLVMTSNPLLNQLHHNILWGMKGNFLDVPTDCPQRDERLGWTGDAQIFCQTAAYLMNTYTFFKKWLRDLKADQTPEGGVPHVAPNIEEGREAGNWLLEESPHSASGWGDAAVIIPWTMYLMTGDRKILELQYDSMKAWIDFMADHSADYIWNYKMQLGDWVALDAEEGSYFGATPTELTCAAFFAYSTGLFAGTARVLGRPEAGAYKELQEHIIRKFQQTYFDADGNMTAQTQTAHILALHFDLVPEQYRRQTVQRLKELLAEKGGHLVTGFLGTPYFCYALSENGAVKEAYDLLLREDFPSWLYQVKQGATTIWEHWDGLKPDGTMWSADMNSFNHYAYGAVGEWMYKVMGGLNPDPDSPGFKNSIYYPRFGGGLQWVETEYRSQYGLHRVKWEVSGDEAELEFSVPVNTTAQVRLDGAAEVQDSDGLNFVRSGSDSVAAAGSGEYRVIFRRKQVEE